MLRIQGSALTLYETRAMQAIAERAWPYFSDTYRHKMEMLIDLEVAHNIFSLDLDAMSTSRIADLIHDVAGIYRHLDRITGKMGGCFTPRFATRGNESRREASDGRQ